MKYEAKQANVIGKFTSKRFKFYFKDYRYNKYLIKCTQPEQDNNAGVISELQAK